MLTIDVSRIPPEGLEIDDPLTPETLHLEDEAEFRLREGRRLRCRVELGDDRSVHVRGRLSAAVEVQCGRCLEPFPLEIAQELDLFYLPRLAEPARDEQEEDVELQDRDLVVAYYDEDVLDLGELVREQIFLGLPMKRVCREDCRGICLKCGGNRNRDECRCVEEEEIDPRLSALRDLLGRGSR